MQTSFDSPIFVAWQLTRDCNLACLHCCTESAPGRKLSDELKHEEALNVADKIIEAAVPYVMLAGGEPLVVSHFWEVAERLGRAGIALKIETNGHLLTRQAAERLSKLPIRSVQVSLDGATEETYQKIRVHGKLEMAHRACHCAQEAGLPLEITFAPNRINIHEVASVLHRAMEFGAFRFNTGRLMRIGTAAKLWKQLECDEDQYRQFFDFLREAGEKFKERIEILFEPSDVVEAMREFLGRPPATLLVLPNGLVKASPVMPFICADLRKQSVPEAFRRYQEAWQTMAFQNYARAMIDEPRMMEASNQWGEGGFHK